MRPLVSAALAAVLLAAPALAAANPLDAIGNMFRGPQMGPMAYPSALVGETQPVLASVREPLPEQPTANSLWRVGARTFFNDQRAGRVGDILTVNVAISDSAKTQNTSNAGLTSSNAIGVPNLFGLESTLGKLIPGADPKNLITTNTANSSTGTGGVNRAEQISLTIGAVVTQVLPNGNLVIQGSQEVRTDNDIRQLTVAGIVRPEDISSANTISSAQIAEARISYAGRGDVSAVQHTPWGTSLLQKFWPF
jgi:flagellar L-ring protein precursor FlgH